MPFPFPQLIAGILALLLALASWQPATAQNLRFGEKQLWLTLPNGVSGIMALGDVNGDGKADLVIYNTGSGLAWVALSTGSGFAAPKLFAGGLPRGGSNRTEIVKGLDAGTAYAAGGAPRAYINLTLASADDTGDGKADFVGFVHGDGDKPGSANVYVALSNGANFTYPAQPVWNDGFCITEQICEVIDLNGDGRADLVAFTPKTGLVWT